MRVLIDTNVFISYLLSPSGTSAIQEIFSAWLGGRFTLLVPEGLVDEILVTVGAKPHLAGRIAQENLREFMAIVQEMSEEVPRIKSPIPAVTRDPEDDYLLAYALVSRAGYLVTSDQDLLELQRQVAELEIVTPRQFYEVLSAP
jgi:putative PIN family toxin of toxin-antitoxin system